jgi:hypothetical protein
MDTHAFHAPRSTRIDGLTWMGPRIGYPEPAVKGDTFPMTWAADGNIYASAGDPCWGTSPMGLDVERFSGNAPEYRIEKVNEMPAYDGPGGKGPKPSGMISVGGILYLAVQNTLGEKPPAHGDKSQHGSDATIIRSSDFGRTWTPGRDAAPMFPGSLFGGPAFVNFGRDNAGARDGYVYAVSSDQWDNGSAIRLGRAPRDRIMDRPAWEWIAAADGAEPRWTAVLEDSVPVLAEDRFLSIPEMVYLAPIRRYLLLTWRLVKDFSTDGSELIVFDAPEPWGPFSLAHHEPVWEAAEVNPYCPRIPLKWMEEDGVTGWIQFSGSWQGGGSGPYYRSHVRRFRLAMRKGE